MSPSLYDQAVLLHTSSEPHEMSLDSFQQDPVTTFQPEAVPSLSTSTSSLSAHLIGAALESHISSIDHEVCDAGDEDSFFVCDLGEVKRSFQLWKKHLPQVHPHYAVKCNTNVEVLRLLARLGANFDCASKAEIDTVLALGVSSDRIVYANPCKTNSFIRSALKSGITLTTVDNAQELVKMKKYHPECGILLRIATDDETAQCRLSTKFGCSLKTAREELLPLAHSLQLNVQGVAFHVGSGAKDFESIRKAVSDSRAIFETGYQLGFKMTTLDIGGGFERCTFSESSAMVNSSLAEFFPVDYTSEHGIKFIAEPGRFMVANAFTLATHVIARREVPDGAMIYTNDGVYGNMNCILFDHQQPIAHVLTCNDEFLYNKQGRKDSFTFSIWGPTCDGLDCVSSSTMMPYDIDVGDWLYFPNLGAYTSAASTSFNGFKSEAHVIYVDSSN